MSESYVYIMTAGTLIKIGVSDDPEKRLKAVQTGNGRKVMLVHKHETISKNIAFMLEKKMHKIYKKHKTSGEWFSGLSIKRVISTLERIHNKYNNKLGDFKLRCAEDLKLNIGAKEVIDFVNNVDKKGLKCDFYIEVEGYQEVKMCLLALSKGKYNQKLKRYVENKSHIAHLNKIKAVYQEYENWQVTGRSFMKIPREYLIPNKGLLKLSSY